MRKSILTAVCATFIALILFLVLCLMRPGFLSPEYNPEQLSLAVTALFGVFAAISVRIDPFCGRGVLSYAVSSAVTYTLLLVLLSILCRYGPISLDVLTSFAAFGFLAGVSGAVMSRLIEASWTHVEPPLK